MKEGSPVISASLVSPSISLASDSWTDIENFLEEVTLDRPTIGDFCSKHCYFVAGAAPFLVPQTNDFIVQVLDASFDRTNQELFSWVQ
jgi:hypothetical protein